MTPTALGARDWLLGIVRGLVHDPAAVEVLVLDANGTLELRLIAPPNVRARIIGRGGATIGLVRQLAYVYAQTQHISRITVSVFEPERSQSRHVTETPVR